MDAKVKMALEKAWARGSRKGHMTGLRDFIRWAEGEGIPDEQLFPAPSRILEAYIAQWTGRKGSASTGNKVYGIRAFHIANHLRWEATIQVKYLLEAVKKEVPRGDMQKPRRPVTRNRLEILAEGLDAADPKDAAVRAMAFVAFYAQARLGELLPTTMKPEAFDPKFHPVGIDVGEDASDRGTKLLHLPWTKVKKEKGEDVVIAAQRGHTNPVTALQDHIFLNDIGDDDPLASYLDKDGVRRILTVRAMMARCNELWAEKGLVWLTGHCFRIGGTTFYLLAGVSTDVVKALGRWSSDAFLRYWRSLEHLGILHIEMIAPPRFNSLAEQ
ncbi:DNA breaking-rejoining enzyme [Hymenopellis radicata]|nr:DNA breaking-rejoining enzyme [Hymenopellis radicata]